MANIMRSANRMCIHRCFPNVFSNICLLTPQGNKCPFRHSAAALGSEEVCDLWLKGQCNRKICAFRHSIVDVSIILCMCLHRVLNHFVG